MLRFLLYAFDGVADENCVDTFSRFSTTRYRKLGKGRYQPQFWISGEIYQKLIKKTWKLLKVRRY